MHGTVAYCSTLQNSRRKFVCGLLAIVAAFVCPAVAVNLRWPLSAKLNGTNSTAIVFAHQEAEDGKALEGSQTWTALDADFSEDSADAAAWRNATIPNLVSGDPKYVVPPKCPSDISADAEYWLAKKLPDRTHTVCEFADGCNRMGTNRERHDSIRRALVSTKQLLDGKGIPYVLYGGSAIGQHRCQDVLPWDSDCDVLVKTSDISKLHSGPLGNGFVLRYKSTVIPFAVVDTTTGFYCDIFQMDFEEATGTVAVSWPFAPHVCPQFPAWSQQPGEPAHCEKYPMHMVYPYATCKLNGVEHKCARDQPKYLAEKYGEGWDKPNVATETGLMKLMKEMAEERRRMER